MFLLRQGRTNESVNGVFYALLDLHLFMDGARVPGVGETVDLILKGARIVSLGPLVVVKGVKRVEDKVVIAVFKQGAVIIVWTFGVIIVAELIDFFIFHHLKGRVSHAIGYRLLNINIGEVGEVDGHLADGVAQLGVIEAVFCLSYYSILTLFACSTVSYSMKNLVTSPFSKISSFTISPNWLNLVWMLSFDI